MARFDLPDVEWSVISPLLPNKPCGVARGDDRRVLNGIFWRLRTGAPWADIPDRYGPHTTCVNRFNRWRKAAVWDRLFGSCVKGLRRRYSDDRVILDPPASARCQRQKKTIDPVAWVARGAA
jgi:transposase